MLLKKSAQALYVQKGAMAWGLWSGAKKMVFG